jgi:hypothetical protein
MHKIILASLLLMLSLSAQAESDEEQILAIIEASRTGWEQADGTPFRQYFLDWEGARYFESGGQNVGLTDLIEDHVEPEGHALTLDLEFNNPQIQFHGDIAWVLTDTVVRATVKSSGREIHNRGHQTTILKKINGTWKVLHTHSSSRPVKKTL